ncbi:MAG: hypothetical protein JXB29_03760 [Sedimentisphaerales bacterium]|nr:hypothetical protein [Sedimentisphaerales bacterium]
MGKNYSGLVLNCYALGDVNGTNKLGGLAGYNTGDVTNCYPACEVGGTSDRGGLAGYSSFSSVYSGCFWDSQIAGSISGIGNIAPDPPGVAGKSTSEMMSLTTFISAGWDFVAEDDNGRQDIWRLCKDGVSYPGLYFEFLAADFLCPDGVDFIDFAFFADYWLKEGCSAVNDCSRSDIDFSGRVDESDLAEFSDCWLLQSSK